jgi:hypothetical protein
VPDAAVRIMLFSLPRIVSDLLHTAAREHRDIVLIDRGDDGTADLAGHADAMAADVVITSTEVGSWPWECATLVVERSPFAVYALDTEEGGTCTFESRGLGQLSPDELLVSAVARARTTG